MADSMVFNATLEKWPIVLTSRYFAMEPRSVTKVPEDMAWMVERFHNHKGLFIVRFGDDIKSQERQALIKYRSFLNARIKRFQSWLDQMKLEGKTVDKPKLMLRYERWFDEVTKKLEIEAPLDQELSYLDDDHMKNEDVAGIFAGFKQNAVLMSAAEDAATRPIRKKKPISSFTEVASVEEDLGIKSALTGLATSQ